MEKNLDGLTSEEVLLQQQKFGKNLIAQKKKLNVFKRILKTICEPMFLLLLIAAAIYFILGDPGDGAVMLVFVVFIIAIELIQEWKADKTLQALKDLSEPKIKVVRNGKEEIIFSYDLVPNDLMIISEGSKVPADGFIVKAFDLCVDESTLTGESACVWKSENEDGEGFFKKNYVYAGTLVTQGSGYINVEKTGLNTEYGKIGKGVSEAKDRPTPLEKQTGKLVKIMAVAAGALFILVGIVTYFSLINLAPKDRIIQSILAGLALAMAMIPEEFPVILTIFLSMGAWRLAKNKSLVRNISAVETLGAVSVLCVDKTGTITKNQMTVFETVSYDTELVRISGLACEIETYDPMEKAILRFCEEQGFDKNKLFSGKLIQEFSFTNELKMMGHIWETGEKTILCAKGSPESIIALCGLTKVKELKIQKRIKELSAEGLRVIAVGKQILTKEKIPSSLLDCKLTFCGLIALYDPPRESVKMDIEKCIRAGIRVVMITGDSGVTAGSIANEVGILNCEKVITGEEIEQMTEEELCNSVKTVNIFSRVVPEHKMRIVKAFQLNGGIVAMTGDGVNDAAALKNADIGIAMGKRGSEVSREAADLVLLDDNFSTIVDTVKDGRRIYQNIKKAIGYVLTIHIPIALIALIAPFLKILPENLMLQPLHIVLLELIIDPTCSIVLERQKAERNIMEQKPRNPKEKLINLELLTKSVLQGLVIFAAAFLSYYFMNPTSNPEAARSMGIAVLMLSNLFLVFVNSSEKDFAITSFKQLIKDKIIIISNVALLALLMIVIYTPLNSFLKLAPLSLAQIFIALGISVAAVFWYELVKLFKKIKKNGIRD